MGDSLAALINNSDDEESVHHTLHFYVSDDYRTGHKLFCLTEDEFGEDLKKTDSEFYECVMLVKYNLPNEGFDFRINIVRNLCDDNKVIWSEDFETFEFIDLLDEKEVGCGTYYIYSWVYRLIFSQVHGVMPFKVTGLTSSYKEEGDYPEVPQKIKDFPQILPDSVVKEIIECNSSVYYFAFLVDNENDILFKFLIVPVF
jgi:hypothetical protein